MTRQPNPTEYRPPSPDSMLRGVVDLAGSIQAAWPAYEHVSAWLANAVLRAAAGPSRGSDVPDPVSDIVASHEPYWETVAEVTEWFQAGRRLQRKVADAMQEHPDIAQEGDRMRKSWRCTGVTPDGELINLTCTRYADRLKGKYAGMCTACIKQVQRAEEKAS